MKGKKLGYFSTLVGAGLIGLSCASEQVKNYIGLGNGFKMPFDENAEIVKDNIYFNFNEDGSFRYTIVKKDSKTVLYFDSLDAMPVVEKGKFDLTQYENNPDYALLRKFLNAEPGKGLEALIGKPINGQKPKNF